MNDDLTSSSAPYKPYSGDSRLVTTSVKDRSWDLVAAKNTSSPTNAFKTNYYLEKVYYKHASNQYYPLALLLHLNSYTLLDDKEQQRWLRHITDNLCHDMYSQFPHKVLLTQHTVFFAADVSGSRSQSTGSVNYPGCHQRQLGCVLRLCGLKLSNWLVYTNASPVTAIIGNYGHQDLPKLQVAFSKVSKAIDYKTMIPGLLYTYEGEGCGCLNLETDGSLTVSFFEGSTKKHFIQSEFYRRYNPNGQIMYRLGEQPRAAKLHPRLLKRTRGAVAILQLLDELLKHQETMDWRLLSWSIIAYVDWWRDVYKRRVSSQLFHPLLQLCDPQKSSNNPWLTPELLDNVLNGIEHCFDYYLDERYTGYYSTLFRQLALWHQALEEVKRLLKHQNTLSGSLSRRDALARNITIRHQFEQWSSSLSVKGLTKPIKPEETDPHSESLSEISIPDQEPSDTNEFGKPNQLARSLSNIQVNHTLDELIKRPDVLKTRLQGACLKALLQRFGSEDWSYYAWAMHRYNEFAQAFLLMALLQWDLVQALGSMFKSYQDSWLSYMLESELISCYEHDRSHPLTPIFSETMQDYLEGHNDQQQGEILRGLALVKAACWQHLLAPKSHFNLTRQPLVKQQLYQMIGWDKRKCQKALLTAQINGLYRLNYSWYRQLLDWFLGAETESFQTVYNAYYQQVNNVIDYQSDETSIDSFTFFQSELTVKRFLDDKQKVDKQPPWYQPLQDLTEWLFIADSTNDHQQKWQMLQTSGLHN